VQAEDMRMGAGVARKGGQASQTAARIGAVSSTLLTGSSLLLDRYGWSNTNTRRAA
jgi:hypothetical protein